MTTTTRPRYLDPDCPLTLAEGLAEFAAASPDLLPAVDPELREFIRAHDSCHVLFGLTTSIEDGALADTWTIFGSTVPVRRYAAYLKHDQVMSIFRDAGMWAVLRGTLRAIPRAIRAIVRARRMTAKWPFFGYAEHLDTPIAALRRRYGVRPV